VKEVKKKKIELASPAEVVSGVEGFDPVSLQ
jgi:hypothetical protein